ncbi:MAG: hypothetical protein CMJ19_22930 [Phycisphaeraceae bacterium]|nr:hypothetical protein [Phycisphaeraceae bacterium]
MRRQHGYTLIEMLFVIGFCFLLLLLTSFIFTTSTKLIKAQHTVIPELKQVDAMVDQLREDVWDAKTVTVVSEHELQLATDDGSVQWSLDDAGLQWVRKQSDRQRYFPGNMVQMNFKIAPAGVTAVIGNQLSRDPVTMRLLSVTMLKEMQHDR